MSRERVNSRQGYIGTLQRLIAAAVLLLASTVPPAPGCRCEWEAITADGFFFGGGGGGGRINDSRPAHARCHE